MKFNETPEDSKLIQWLKQENENIDQKHKEAKSLGKNIEFNPETNDISSGIEFFSDPKNLIDEKERALHFVAQNIIDLSVEEIVDIYKEIINEDKFDVSKNSVKLLYFIFFESLKNDNKKYKLISVLEELIQEIKTPMLHLYIENEIDLMKGIKKETVADIPVFKISKDRYGAIFENGVLYLADNEDSKIINKNLKLIKWPKNFEEDQARITAVHKIEDILMASGPITSERLTSSGLIKGEKTKIDQDYGDYLGFLDNISKRVLLENFNFNFNDLTLQEQFQFISFLKKQSLEKTHKIIDFSKKFNVDGFRTFLSIEQGGKEMGDKILELGNSEKLPEDIARKIFTKYGEIIDKADNTEEEIKKIFGNKEVPVKVLSSVKETLLKRGAKMLSDLGDKVQDEKFVVNEQEILDELDQIKEETIILGKSFEKLYREGISVPIEDVTQIKEISTSDITKEQKQLLIKVYENGRPEGTYKNKEHLKLLVDEFTEELNDKNISVLEISFNGENIIIAVVDKKDKDTLYVGGLTFVDDVRNAAIAEASMSYVLEKFKNYNIRALVDSKNSILRMYLKRFGFRITKKLDTEEEMSKNAGELYYEIERPKEESKEKPLEIAA